jgi:hypothetical protein
MAVPDPLAIDHRWQGSDKTLVYKQISPQLAGIAGEPDLLPRAM